MADANETSADIIAEMETERPGLMNAPINTNNLYYARRLKAALERERCDCANLPELSKTVDTRFDICQDIALVLKIGRDFQNKDGYRGAHYDTVKLLCDAIEYQQEQAAKLREALKMVRDAHYTKEVEGELYEGFEVEVDDGTGRPLICVVEAALAATSSQKEDNK